MCVSWEATARYRLSGEYFKSAMAWPQSLASKMGRSVCSSSTMSRPCLPPMARWWEPPAPPTPPSGPAEKAHFLAANPTLHVRSIARSRASHTKIRLLSHVDANTLGLTGCQATPWRSAVWPFTRTSCASGATSHTSHRLVPTANRSLPGRLSMARIPGGVARSW